jgi:hypothetical protein
LTKVVAAPGLGEDGVNAAVGWPPGHLQEHIQQQQQQQYCQQVGKPLLD